MCSKLSVTHQEIPSPTEMCASRCVCRTCEMFCAVDLWFEVAVSVAGGERKPAGICAQSVLQVPWRPLLEVKGVAALLSSQSEGILDGLDLVVPVSQLHLQNVAPLSWQGVDLLQTQPELSWKKNERLTSDRDKARGGLLKKNTVTPRAVRVRESVNIYHSECRTRSCTPARAGQNLQPRPDASESLSTRLLLVKRVKIGI